MADVIMAIATLVIAFYAVMSYRLVSKMQSRDEEYRQQVSDLYQAIVISSLVAAGRENILGSMQGRIEVFHNHYKGKTPIFD